MRAVTITKSHDGKKIGRVLRQLFPSLPPSELYKAFRKRDIKINGIRVKEDHQVLAGDIVQIYITDEILDKKGHSTPSQPDASHEAPKAFTVVFQDSNLIIVNKEQGIFVQPEKDRQEKSLIELVNIYIKENSSPYEGEGISFTPSLCHRLDRNTGGLVIIAKNQPALDAMLHLIKHREIKKYYLCYVKGKMPSKCAELKGYLFKDQKKSRVYVSDVRTAGSQEIITRYRVLEYIPEKDISRLEVELVTGRTHQIRAHLAHGGHPIIGDGKYGTNAINRPLGAKTQMLWAYKLVFDFNEGGVLNYLKGREFSVEPGFKI